MFNYKCPECGKGIVREKREPYEVNFRGIKFLVPDALLGVCDHCGARNFDGKEYQRWEKLFEKSLQEKQKPLSPSEIKRIREQMGLNQRQFAVMIGCTRQSIYNWENPRRRVPQSRQADLMIRLLAERLQNENVDVLEFLLDEAEKVGVKFPRLKLSGEHSPTNGSNRASVRARGNVVRHPRFPQEEFEKIFGGPTKKPDGFRLKIGVAV